jgi:predicted XRE-type DNA-binding protein
MPRNVFEDLGFSPEEAANLKIKTDLHTKIVRRAGHYTQQELQKILSTSQPRISDLLHGKMSKFSLEMLLIYAQKLGFNAEIKTTEARKQARSRGTAAGVSHFVL